MHTSTHKDITYFSKTKINVQAIMIMRIIMLIFLLGHYLLYLTIQSFASLLAATFKYLTLWALILTIIYFAVGIFERSNRIPIGVFSLFNHFVLALNITVTVFFYAFLFDSSRKFSIYKYLYIMNHTFPILFSIVDFILNHNIFYYKNIPLLLPYPFLYLLVNYLFTEFEVEPVYPMMDFKSAGTVLYIFLAIILFLISLCIGIWIQAIKKFLFYKSSDSTKNITFEYRSQTTNESSRRRKYKNKERIQLKQKNKQNIIIN